MAGNYKVTAILPTGLWQQVVARDPNWVERGHVLQFDEVGIFNEEGITYYDNPVKDVSLSGCAIRTEKIPVENRFAGFHNS